MIDQFKTMYYFDDKKTNADETTCKYSLEPLAMRTINNCNDRITKLKKRIKNDYIKSQLNKKYQVNGFHEAKIIKKYIEEEIGKCACFYEDDKQMRNKVVKINDSGFPQHPKKIFQTQKFPVIYVQFVL